MTVVASLSTSLGDANLPFEVEEGTAEWDDAMDMIKRGLARTMLVTEVDVMRAGAERPLIEVLEGLAEPLTFDISAAVSEDREEDSMDPESIGTYDYEEGGE